MKKFFSLIALVGVFAACQPEDLKTIFESAPASLTINVTKVINNVDGAEVTGVATKSTFTATGNPDIPAGTATLTATYNDAKGETVVPYPHILADTDPVVMGCTVYIPGAIGNYKIDVKSVAGDPVTTKFILEEAKTHGYNHAGSNWVENASDYVLSDSCTYDDINGEEFSALTVKDAAFEDMAKAIYETASKDAEKKAEKGKVWTFEAPAWSLYNVVSEQIVTVVNYYVTATATGGAPTVGETVDGVDNVVATFSETVYVTSIGLVKMEHPGHAGHAGHGGHGTGNNAGGGLVEE